MGSIIQQLAATLEAEVWVLAFGLGNRCSIRLSYGTMNVVNNLDFYRGVFAPFLLPKTALRSL